MTKGSGEKGGNWRKGGNQGKGGMEGDDGDVMEIREGVYGVWYGLRK